MQFHRFTERIKGLEDESSIRGDLRTGPRGLHPQMTGVSPHSASHAATGFLAQLSGSNINNDGTVFRVADTDGPSQTPHIADLYAQATTKYTEEVTRGPHSPCRRGSTFSWWALSRFRSTPTMPHSDHDDWGLTARSTATANLNHEFSTPASSRADAGRPQCDQPKLTPLARLASCLRTHQSRSTNSRRPAESPGHAQRVEA